MSKPTANRSKWIHIRLSEGEFKRINAGFSRSTNRKRSEYIRHILLGKPVTIYTRSKSLDDFLEEMIVLRRELNWIGNNFNQTVVKLHTLSHISEIKTWAVLNEKDKSLFFKKIDELENKISQIDSQWLQK